MQTLVDVFNILTLELFEMQSNRRGRCLIGSGHSNDAKDGFLGRTCSGEHDVTVCFGIIRYGVDPIEGILGIIVEVTVDDIYTTVIAPSSLM